MTNLTRRATVGIVALTLIVAACASDTPSTVADSSPDDSATDGVTEPASGPAPSDDGDADTSTTPTTPVDAEPPTDLRVQIDNADVVLRWADPTNPDGVEYVVARDGDEVATTSELEYRDAGLDDGAYRYQVFARVGRGEPSEPFTVVAQVGIPDVFPPSDPTGVELQVVDGKVVITWNESLDDRGVRGYLIHRDRDFYAWVTDDLKFVDNHVDPDRTYHYRVRAQDDAANNSAPVGGIVSTGEPDVTPPSVPVVDSVDVDGQTVTIDWDDATDDREIWGYLVHRDGLFHAWVSEKSEFREAVEPGATHQYVIRAQDGAGNNSEPSEVLDIAVG